MANTFTGDLDKIVNSYELKSALSSLTGSSKMNSGTTKSGISDNDVDKLSNNAFNFSEGVFGELLHDNEPVPASFENAKEAELSPSDIKSLVVEKGVAIAAIVKTVSQGILSPKEIQSLDGDKQGEIKFFSVVLIGLKLLNESGILGSILDFIKDKIAKNDHLDDADLSATQKHELIESALLSKMESEVLPILDKQIPGGINTIRFVLDAVS